MDAHGHGHHDPDFDWGAMVDFAELDAEVSISLLQQAMSVLADLAHRRGLTVARILDIGSGPGVGTSALADTFPSAAITAADGSAEMLARVRARAERLGIASRVDTRLVDLPDGLDGLGQADLVWASLVLHHVGDETAALRRLRARLEAGGLLALGEFADRPRFLPESADLGSRERWERLDEAMATWLADMRSRLPGSVPSGDYPTMIEGAGFEVLVDRVISLELATPLDERARRLAFGHLSRMREHVGPFADPADLATLDVLIDEDDPRSILHRDDAVFRSSRRLLVATAT